MPDVLEQLAQEWGESLRRASLTLPRDSAEARFVLRVVASFVSTLSAGWEVLKESAKRGGLPGKRLLRTCDLLLSMAATPDEALRRVEEFCAEERVPPVEPAELALLRAELEAGRQRLQALVRELQKVRPLLAEPPRISASPEDLKRRAERADREGEWVPMREAIARRKKATPPEREP
jgi:hypothetical protein